MATVTSHLFTEMHGSVAGMTYQSASNGKTIARKKPLGSGGRSSKFNRWLMYWNYAITRWPMLTDESRQTWHRYAENLYPGKTGRDLFLHNIPLMYYIRYLSGYAFASNLDAPKIPVTPAFSAILVTNLVHPVVGFRVSVYNSGVNNAYALVRLSGAQSAAKNTYFGNKSALSEKVMSVPAGSNGGATFSDLKIGMKYFFTIDGITIGSPCRRFSSITLSHTVV